ncbi:Mut7-C RNAse domain-containing protein [candidate division WOR-3 bacterium]|nr:Mut7-C RNAse domain-containing protein [candidate division WOR-3 bacterium]
MNPGRPEHRFIVDAMLGKLARWLRVLGWDSEYVKGKSTEVLLKKAKAEGRILLTRKQGLTDERLVFVENEKLTEQLVQLERKFRVLSAGEPFTRCIECNEKLEEVDKAQVKGKVPFYTYETQEKFYRCPGCGKVFWPGSHHEAMLWKLRKLKP